MAAWMSRDMNRAEPPVIANGVVYAYGNGENTEQAYPEIGLAIKVRCELRIPPTPFSMRSMAKRARNSIRAATRLRLSPTSRAYRWRTDTSIWARSTAFFIASACRAIKIRRILFSAAEDRFHARQAVIDFDHFADQCFESGVHVGQPVLNTIESVFNAVESVLNTREPRIHIRLETCEPRVCRVMLQNPGDHVQHDREHRQPDRKIKLSIRHRASSEYPIPRYFFPAWVTTTRLALQRELKRDNCWLNSTGLIAIPT